MSKSYENTIALMADRIPTAKRIQRIVTDSTTPQDPKDPEACTLIALLRAFADAPTIADLEARYRTGGIGYGEVKAQLADAINAHVAPMRDRCSHQSALGLHEERAGVTLWVRRNVVRHRVSCRRLDLDVVLEVVACEHVSEELVAVPPPPVMLSGIGQPVSHRDHDLPKGGVFGDLRASTVARPYAITLLVVRCRHYASSMQPDSVALRASAMTRL
jgi:hypothetical protein